MNTRAAIDETMVLARKSTAFHNSWAYYHETLGYRHLVQMHEKIDNTFDESKLSRWLGWMQAAVVAWDVVGVEVETMKEINRRHT